MVWDIPPNIPHLSDPYERTTKINALKKEPKDKSRFEGFSKLQDSNKSNRVANYDQKKARGDKKDKGRSKDKACYKCELPGHQTRDCKAKEQALHDTQAMLNTAKVGAVATRTTVSIRGVLNTNPPFDELVSMNISSDAEIESGLDIESNITSMTGEVFSVDAWETKVRAVQQRIKEL